MTTDRRALRGLVRYSTAASQAIRKLILHPRRSQHAHLFPPQAVELFHELCRQAGKAKRYKQLSLELQHLDTQLARHQLDVLLGEIRDKQTAADALRAEIETGSANVLRHEDRELSGLFSGVQKGEGRFRDEQWTRLFTGAPVLKNALVAFDCRVVNRMVHGTHTIYLGEVEQLLIGRKGKPLMYADGQYAKLASLAHGEPLPEGLDYWGE